MINCTNYVRYCYTAGSYFVTGYFTQQVLEDFNLSNPKDFTVRMVINVYEKGPPDNLRGFLLETDPNGNTLIKLMLPALPMDTVTAVYIYRSDDNARWKQESWSGQPGTGGSLVRTEGRRATLKYLLRKP